MLSDLLTTTVFTLGPEKGLKLIDSLQEYLVKLPHQIIRFIHQRDLKIGL